MKTLIIRTKMSGGGYVAKILNHPGARQASCTMGSGAAAQAVLAKNVGNRVKSFGAADPEEAAKHVPKRYLKDGKLPEKYGVVYWQAEVSED